MTLSVKHVLFNKLVTILHTRSLVTLPYLASISVVLAVQSSFGRPVNIVHKSRQEIKCQEFLLPWLSNFLPPISYDLLVRLTFGLLHSTFLIKGHQLFMM